jgi:hypothetical protein
MHVGAACACGRQENYRERWVARCGPIEASQVATGKKGIPGREAGGAATGLDVAHAAAARIRSTASAGRSGSCLGASRRRDGPRGADRVIRGARSRRRA